MIRSRRPGACWVTGVCLLIWPISILDSNGIERFRGVAARAMGAKAAIVYIVLLVTVAAGGGKFDFIFHRALVAAITGQPLMGTVQLKIGLVVVEYPQAPVVGVVAASAIRPQLPLVHVIRFVTSIAVKGGFLELGTKVTLLTGGDGV